MTVRIKAPAGGRRRLARVAARRGTLAGLAIAIATNNAQANQMTITGGARAGDPAANLADNPNLNVQCASAAAVVTSARASIGAHAFSNASGALMANQSADAGNIQSTSEQPGTAAIGVETVSDAVLSAAAATNSGRDARPRPVAFARPASAMQLSRMPWASRR